MDKLLKILRKSPKQNASVLADQLKVSRQALHKKLKKLVLEGKVLKVGSSPRNTFFLLNQAQALQKVLQEDASFRKKILLKQANETEVFNEASQSLQLPARLKANIVKILHYAFTEMCNNAIDHSRSQFAKIEMKLSQQSVSFHVDDTGIGIFHNLKSKKHLESELEAIQELIKGKQTTFPEKHSGEGIFFTSKIASRFVIQSHKKQLIFDNRIHDIFISDIRFKKGTRVFFEIDLSSKQELQNIFNLFTGEEFEFDKSLVTVKLFKEGTDFISRSQAKRILSSLDSFTKIILDFKGVETVGQGFADEVFRVFQKQHPNIKIIPQNMHENVEFMVKRALANTIN